MLNVGLGILDSHSPQLYPSGSKIGPQGHHMALSMNAILKEGYSRQCNGLNFNEESLALNSPASMCVIG